MSLRDAGRARLGDVLYGNNAQVLVSEATWVSLLQSIARGDQLALHRLYVRMHGIVFTWIIPFVSDREAAKELTLDVLHDVWRTASTYKGDSVIGWIMNHARSRAMELKTPPAPAIDTVLPPQIDVMRPSTSLWLPLARRIGAETGEEPLLPLPEGRVEPEWEEVAPGISCKLLATDRTRKRVSMLVRLAPGAAYPPHTHAGVEELYLLRGELMIEDRTLHPGAYNRGEPGGSDQFVWTGTGCMCVLLTSTQDVLGEMPRGDPKVLQQFRAFMGSLRRQRYCLDCVSRIYEQPANAVWTCLHQNGIVGSYAECGNCGKSRQTFRYVGASES